MTKISAVFRHYLISKSTTQFNLFYFVLKIVITKIAFSISLLGIQHCFNLLLKFEKGEKDVLVKVFNC